MRWLRGLGLVLGGAAVWTPLLWAARYYALPFPFGLFAPVLACGLPAFFLAALAYRWRLPLPVAWAAAGYCLGSGVATAILMGDGEPPARYVEAALTHAGSLTMLAPAVGGGSIPLVGNLLWLAVVVIVGIYGVETYQKGRPAPRREEPPAA